MGGPTDQMRRENGYNPGTQGPSDPNAGGPPPIPGLPKYDTGYQGAYQDLLRGLPSLEESPEEASLFESLQGQARRNAGESAQQLSGYLSQSASSRGLLGSGIDVRNQLEGLGGIGRELESQLGELGQERYSSAIQRRRNREEALQAAEDRLFQARISGLMSEQEFQNQMAIIGKQRRAQQGRA
jgi:hypothetical protein